MAITNRKNKMIKQLKGQISEYLKIILRGLHNYSWRRQLHNHDFSIISNNCVGGCVLHDLGQRFDSPTVNVAIPFPDYIKMLKDIKYYLHAEFEDITGDGKGIESLRNVPKGLLGGGYNCVLCSLSNV